MLRQHTASLFNSQDAPMTDELSVQTPGGDAATAADDVNAGRIAELEATVAQQAAMISQLNAELRRCWAVA